jgi:hypothetical protein
MKELQVGDICRVRRHTGEAVDAIYFRHHTVYGVKVKKTHIVKVGDISMLASPFSPHANTGFYERVRFIGPAGVRS